MKVYMLTDYGKRVSGSIRGGNSMSWKVLYHLRLVGRATDEELRGMGASPSDVARLQRHPALIQEVGL